MNKKKLNPCERIVRQDECERNDPSDEIWWKNTFESLEKKYRFVSNISAKSNIT